ncbi:MAG: CocE/NonD family hydrolase [Gammaproteobacteria bacterium]|nr:CocE/NonD family hydrolase [Gammaproteobacteria bacterium]NIR83575.1 CocE/NonD family hydrolase [Gammaproteobacteria bacterium]NIR91497.1 CocE/NonD family hydrolase [Gammaproteobacteria bacterium]NIU04737.1 CocE/NonD family hydrolase [Gammaproteobacteria bacterium]NIV51779.1 CocE/NonD family hydrolase [Gammaproteobacteria bacterium]
MRIIESFPHNVREIENVWIPLPDGCRLAARLWLSEDAETHPVPAILEYIPYRKRDFMRLRDEPIHYYFAGHGYAAVRLDVRGAGDSDGVLVDEYTPQELEDALAVLRWIGQQPWCTGDVGMMGISWGGFNSLQVAALQPPELKAIITLCSTDDRYADDAHYMGGCLLNENLQWGSILWTSNAYPPDPEIVGERWRSLWMQRLERSRLFPAIWLGRQRRDDYWKHGSVCEDFSRIRCPVYAVGGWADGYSNAIPRLLAGLEVPRKGLVGPWAHTFPQEGVPGPAIGFLQEAVRWWDHWLKGEDTGIMDEPMYRVWMQESVPPDPFYEERPGRWVAETRWPSPHVQHQRLHLNPGRLDSAPAEESRLELMSPQTTGLTAGNWCGFGLEGEAPTDQRPDDGGSLVFDSDALEERMEILGAPAVTLELEVDRPVALVAVRLNDVAPDGAATRVTYGLLNLTHRQSHEHPEAVQPGRRCRVSVQLNDAAHAFPAGHRLRIAVSTSYWPIAWPSPEPTRLTLYAGTSSLDLPVRPPRAEDAQLRPFEGPERAFADTHTKLRPVEFKRSIERDLATNETVYTLVSDGGELEGASLARVDAIDLEVGYTIFQRYRIGEYNPLSAHNEITQRTRFKRGEWSIRIESRVRMWATRDTFRLQAELDAYESGARVFARSWDESVPRDLV